MGHSRLLSFILLVLVAAACRNSDKSSQAFVTFSPSLRTIDVDRDVLENLFPEELCDSQVNAGHQEIGIILGAIPLTGGNEVRVADTRQNTKQFAILFSNGKRIMMTLNAKGLFGWHRIWQSESFQGDFNSGIRAVDLNCDGTPEIVASFQLGPHFYESNVIYTFDADTLMRMHEPIQYVNRSVLFGSIAFDMCDTGTTIVVGTPGPMGPINTYFIGRGSKTMKFVSTNSRWPNSGVSGDST